MKITILCVGKCKEKFMQQAVAEYEKRLGRYVKMQIIEVPDEKTPDGASEKLEKQIKEKEGRRLLDKIRQDDEVIALAIDGEQKTSEQFAAQIDQYGIMGKAVSYLSSEDRWGFRKKYYRGQTGNSVFPK